MQLLWRKVCLLGKREIKSSRVCLCPAPHHVYLASSATGWELTNSLHGLILQTCTPANEAYSWKHYACIPVSEQLGRNLLPRLPRGRGWHRPSHQPGTIGRAPAAQQATEPGQEHEIPHALKDTLWPCSRPHLDVF